MTASRPLDGPDYFTVDAYGHGVPGIMANAADLAQRVYGPAARLRVIKVGALHSAASSRAPGPLTARVLVHCVNYDEALDVVRDRLAEASTARLLTELAEFLGAVAGGQYDPAIGYGGLPERVPQWPG